MAESQRHIPLCGPVVRQWPSEGEIRRIRRGSCAGLLGYAEMGWVWFFQRQQNTLAAIETKAHPYDGLNGVGNFEVRKRRDQPDVFERKRNAAEIDRYLKVGEHPGTPALLAPAM